LRRRQIPGLHQKRRNHECFGMHDLRWCSSYKPGQQLGFGQSSDSLGSRADEAIEFFVERPRGLLQMLVFLQGADSVQCLHELLDHSQDVISSDHYEITLSPIGDDFS